MARGTCWVGYEQKGMKKKGNKMVPNCVPAGMKKANALIIPEKDSMIITSMILGSKPIIHRKT